MYSECCTPTALLVNIFIKAYEKIEKHYNEYSSDRENNWKACALIYMYTTLWEKRIFLEPTKKLGTSQKASKRAQILKEAEKFHQT